MAKRKSKPKTGPPSKRELEVLYLIANDFTNQAAAEYLDISVNTVETHLSNIREKLGVRSSASAIYKVMKSRSFNKIKSFKIEK